MNWWIRKKIVWNGIEAEPPLAFADTKNEKRRNKTKSIHFHGRWARAWVRTPNALALCAYWLLCVHIHRHRTQMTSKWIEQCVFLLHCICLFPFRVINCISLQKRTGDRTPAVICRFRQIHWAVICYVCASVHAHRDHRVNDCRVS